jgi:hypothetical protein
MEFPGGARDIVFDALRFDGDAVVGDISVDATLAFDPQAAGLLTSFDCFLTGTELQLLGVSLAHSLHLTHPQTESYKLVSAHGSVGGFGFANALRWSLTMVVPLPSRATTSRRPGRGATFDSALQRRLPPAGLKT